LKHFLTCFNVTKLAKFIVLSKQWIKGLIFIEFAEPAQKKTIIAIIGADSQLAGGL